MAKKPQAAGRCIFCNGFNLSKEHIWSDWLTKKKIVPPQESHSQNIIYSLVNHQTKKAYFRPDIQKPRQGSLIQRKIRCVCKKCNNGWMSKIVNSARSHAEKIILAQEIEITPEIQKYISTWLSLSCISAEFTHRQSICIPDFDRNFIRENGEPPSDWYIFIGRYEGSEWSPTRYIHNGGKFAVLPANSNDISEAEWHYYQVTTQVLGNFVFHAFSTTNPAVADEFGEKFAPDGMQKIWTPSTVIKWPIPRILSDRELLNIADSFVTYLQKNNWHH